MADHGRSDLCSFYHEPLRTWIETNVNKLAISNHTAFKLDVQATKVPIVYADQWDAPAMPFLLLEQSEVNQSVVNENNSHTMLDSLSQFVWLLSVSQGLYTDFRLKIYGLRMAWLLVYHSSTTQKYF